MSIWPAIPHYYAGHGSAASDSYTYYSGTTNLYTKTIRTRRDAHVSRSWTLRMIVTVGIDDSRASNRHQ